MGHIIDDQGIHPDPAKIKALTEMPLPTSQQGIRRFLGFSNYYRRFVKDYAEISQLLSDLKKNERFKWSKEQEQSSFKALKEAITEDSLLFHPDMNEPFIDHVFIPLRFQQEISQNKPNQETTDDKITIPQSDYQPASNIKETRDGLTFTRGNIAHFLAADGEVKKQNTKLLRDFNLIDLAEIPTKYVALYGCPKIILSDKGTSFLSKLFNQLGKVLRFHHITTSGYRPQSNGALERNHHVLAEYLKTFTDEFTDWNELLPFAMLSYNTTVSITKRTIINKSSPPQTASSQLSPCA
ncbi:uncharacterized protein LOC107046506 [Diachasma alloeum]|uniref:uncharacterized protein LOC107046506 n=1 Tax=Diachasma alloeum TaxID=454923 RepID=UPI0007382D5F|nr:uncharacterized protein LOC107046506 [Diachasma alloeum]